MSNINLDINNFGPINKANIELKKLNIIAGTNGSGKTTSSKLLYCFLTSNSNEKEYLANMSIHERFEAIIANLYQVMEFDRDPLKKLKKLIRKYPKLTDDDYNTHLKKCVKSLKKIIDTSQIKNKKGYLEKLNDVEYALEINSIETRKFFEVSNVLLKSEFRHKDLMLSKADVHFYGKQDDCEFSCKLDSNKAKHGFIIDKGDLNHDNNKNIIYIDSPSIFNSNNVGESVILKNRPYHLRFLSRILKTPKDNDDVYDELFNRKIDEFKDEITSLIGGFIYYDEEKEEFFFKKGENTYSMENTSSGIKQLGIIQMLLSNRTLTENSFLIIDEPEVNLHPEWQVRFAEIIVLMIDKLNISAFINSHSPQLIEAIEVYSTKHGLKNETNFYLTRKNENSKKYNVEKIEYENLYELYSNLGDPYDIIDRVRGENLANRL